MKLDKKQDLNVLYQVCVFFWPIGKTRWQPWPLIGWDIFNFSSETTGRNSTKFDRKQDLISMSSTNFFFPGRSEKQDGFPCLWLAETFSTSLKPLNKFKETWQKGRSQCPLPVTKFVFFGTIGKKQDGFPCLWLAETFSTSPLKPLNKFKETWQEARSQCPLPGLCFSGRLEKKTRWPPLPLIGWDIFDFSSETAEQIQRNLTGSKISMSSTKFVFFGTIGKKTKMAALASDWLRHFRLLLWNGWTEFNETWQEARSPGFRPSLCFFGLIG